MVTGTLGSRLDNKAEDAIVVVMQRLHVDDLTGRLLERGGWEQLSIPAIAEDPQDLTIAPGRVHRRNPGDVLDPVREPRPVLDDIREQLGSATFSAQYQQRPIPAEGMLIKRDWLRFHDRCPSRKDGFSVLQSWDTASKPGEHNDFSVCTTWLVSNNWSEAYLIDVFRYRLDFPALTRKVIELRQHYGADIVLIEDAGSGTSLIQVLGERGLRARAVKPTSDKTVRMSAASVLIEGGHVFLPAGPTPWRDDYIAELLSFPNGMHDDMVDATSQFLGWLAERRKAPQAGAWFDGKFQPLTRGTTMQRF